MREGYGFVGPRITESTDTGSKDTVEHLYTVHEGSNGLHALLFVSVAHSVILQKGF